MYVDDLAKKTKHVIVPGKQDIIGVDGINDVKDYNQYHENEPLHRPTTEDVNYRSKLKKDDKPWPRKDGESRIVTA